MDPFSSVNRSALRWIRTAGSRHDFDLFAGEAQIGHLRWHRTGGSLSTFETSDHQWTLKRGGFLAPHVTIRDATSDQEIARLAAHVNFSVLTVRGGGIYRLQRAGLLVPAWQFTNASGKLLLHIEPVREGRQLVGGVVETEEAGQRLDALPLLAAVSWYYIVLAWFEDEAIAASQAVLSAAS